MSVAPELDPVALGRDTPSATGAQYYTIPESLGWLRPLARELTADAETGIDKALSVVEYVRRRARYDPLALDQLESVAPVDAVLLEGRPATGMDWPQPPCCWPVGQACRRAWPRDIYQENGTCYRVPTQ